MLVVFGGLPGCGKTTVARRLCQELSAAYIRVDEIEQAIRSSDVLRGDIGVAGYAVANALARSNLHLKRAVVVDCVNPVPESREAFHRTGQGVCSPVFDIEVICSDPVEHRRRVEERSADIPGHKVPGWEAVMTMDYVPWSGARLVIDTATCSGDDAVKRILESLT